MSTKLFFFRRVAIVLALILTIQGLVPLPILALTGGPSQPEVQSFEPITASENVNLFTGDFTYNIPLLNIGDYPLNLFYNSGISMDQEASWVGLGWNLNPGCINRNTRGLPDDFSGDNVRYEYNIKNMVTFGVKLARGFQVTAFEFDKLKIGLGASASFGIKHNSYKGVGFDFSISPSISAGTEQKGKLNGGVNFSFGLSFDSQGGVGLNPSLGGYVSKSAKGDVDHQGGLGVGFGINSREGFKGVSTNVSYSQIANRQKRSKDKKESKLSESGKEIETEKPEFHDTRSNSSLSSFIPVTPGQFIPSQKLPFVSFSLSGEISVGAAPTKFLYLNASLLAYYARQALKFKRTDVSSFGYLNLEAARSSKNAALDFIREKDGAYHVSQPCLAIPTLTYDNYSIMGQGTGGSFRPFRNDLGVVYDREVIDESGSGAIGGDIGVGDLVQFGMNVNVNVARTISGRWNNKPFESNYQFGAVNDIVEPYYYRSMGELIPSANTQYQNNIAQSDVIIAPTIEGTRESRNVNPVLKAQFPNGSIAQIGSWKKAAREPRNQFISSVKAQEASRYGLNKKIYYKNANTFSIGNNPSNVLSYDYVLPDSGRKPHHTAEFSVVNPDGKRYVYGLPAYNKVQREVSFSVNGTNPDNNGNITYLNDENSVNNISGDDNYFNATQIPGYAYAYMLTAVLSPDYVDLTGNGPSEDDWGDYTLFNYSLEQSNYKWRSPYALDPQSRVANFNIGLRSIPGDNKGTYLYGEKEIWVLHSIETKTQVAEFVVSNRDDALGVVSENHSGTPSDRGKQVKLDRIDLYYKSERYTSANPVPLQSVHFVYDYSLCRGVPNNSQNNLVNPNVGGKLTLKSVYFTNGTSKKGKLSPYRFNYAPFNPNYHPKEYDRWGNYQKYAGKSAQYHTDFPYVKQIQNGSGEAEADLNATAWHLESILLPSGGEMKIDYEADDYAFVQDRRAMQMNFVEGVGPTSSYPLNGAKNLLYSNQDIFYIYFKINNPGQPVVNNDEDLQYYYLNNFNDYTGSVSGKKMLLYFRFAVKVKSNIPEPEFVSGYAEIRTAGICPNNPSMAWIQVEAANLTDDSKNGIINPIAKAAMQNIRNEAPRHIYPGQMPNQKPAQAFRALLATFSEIAWMGEGDIYLKLKADGIAKECVLAESMIRLFNPNFAKLGGGSRVKRITLKDNFASLANSNAVYSEQYSTVYNYTTTHVNPNNGEEIEISSGVASYEPMIGNEENPFRMPVFYTAKQLLAPDDLRYQEEPFGEQFFPAPIVGYSKVVEMTEAPSSPKPAPNDTKYLVRKEKVTGNITHEFYTAADFPSYWRQGLRDVKKYGPSTIPALILTKTFHHVSASQGFVIEVNDMHGKPKAKWIRDANNQLISGVEYKYAIEPPTNGKKKLANFKKVIDPLGNISDAYIGQEVDITLDLRRQSTVSGGLGIGADLIVTLFLFPIPFPFVVPDVSIGSSLFESAVASKVVYKYGILEEVINHSEGSKVSTKNLIWDKVTGEVLATQTTNEFDDPVFSFAYPAYWFYSGMGPSYHNHGYQIINTNSEILENGLAFFKVPANKIQWFHVGDLVEVDLDPHIPDIESRRIDQFWINKIIPNQSNYPSPSFLLELIDRNGVDFFVRFPSSSISAQTSLRIIQTGRKNQQSLTAASFKSLVNPLSGNYIKQPNVNLKVTEAKAQTFSNARQTFCGNITNCGASSYTLNTSFNPFIAGTLSSWRSLANYIYYTERIQELQNPNIRRSGYFNVFSGFWRNTGSTGWALHMANPSTPDMNWTLKDSITLVTPNGAELESQDASGIYASQLVDHHRGLVFATAANCRFRELANLNFDNTTVLDLTNSCQTRPHLGITGKAGCCDYPFLSTQSHTGLYSLDVRPGCTMRLNFPMHVNMPDDPYNGDGSIISISPDRRVTRNKCLPQFSPDYGKDYELSFWVKSNVEGAATYSTPHLRISYNQNGSILNSIDVLPSGPIIDGWQRAVTPLRVEANSNITDVTITFLPGSNGALIDDLRISPLESKSKGYVYNIFDGRLMAELDENNFATFYEYDASGALIRIKRETERGIFTIKENRNNISKQP